MRVKITNSETNTLLLLALSSGGGQVLEASGSTTIDVAAGTDVSFNPVTQGDYFASGVEISTVGTGYGKDLSPEIVNKMLASSRSKR